MKNLEESIEMRGLNGMRGKGNWGRWRWWERWWLIGVRISFPNVGQQISYAQQGPSDSSHFFPFVFSRSPLQSSLSYPTNIHLLPWFCYFPNNVYSKLIDIIKKFNLHMLLLVTIKKHNIYIYMCVCVRKGL